MPPRVVAHACAPSCWRCCRPSRSEAPRQRPGRASVDEQTYAVSLLRQLEKRKVTGVKWVMDTSRNGAGRNGPESGDTCNPLAARLGKDPRLVLRGAYDGNLWVELPGESDGALQRRAAVGRLLPRRRLPADGEVPLRLGLAQLPHLRR